jgi:predicted porin
MKKQVLALAVLGALAGVAQAQSSVQIYGVLDAGIIERTGTGNRTGVGKRVSNTLGFKGTEDLGNGLKALFQIEMRYEPDTGTTESNARPIFQGQSRVGLQGGFGTVRIGRGLTPFQETVTQFDPYHGVIGPQGFYPDVLVSGYTSQPLDVPGSSNNRFSNAVWYNSPDINGFQINTAIASKENNTNPTALIGRGTAAAPQYVVNAQPSAYPYSISATYKYGIAAFMAAVERNAVETRLQSVGASLQAGQAVKLFLTLARQDRGHTFLNNGDSKSFVVGANYTVGAGKFLLGVGQKEQGYLNIGELKTKQYSLGYEYSLSKRTYLYADASRKTGAGAQTNNSAVTGQINTYAIGMNHSF